jgi:DNA-binding transcriptional LysR family regulator
MELRHLRYFVIVAEEQNVSRAARRLHVSQPPLSRQIRDLEEELGLALFQRTAKSVTLTEAGKCFLSEARAVLLRAEAAVQKVRTMVKGDRGELRIGYAPSLTTEMLPTALRRFEQESPGSKVSLHDLSSEECLQKLTVGKLDLALTVPPQRSAMRGLHFEKLSSHPIACALPSSHRLARRRSLRLTELQSEKFLVYARQDYPEYHEVLDKVFRTASFTPRAMEEYDGVTGLISALVAGRGVAMVPTSIKRLAGTCLKLIPLTPPLPPVIVGALFAKEATPLVQRFVSILKQAE